MFPLAVQFFTPEEGIEKKLIDFVENPDESSQVPRNSAPCDDQMAVTQPRNQPPVGELDCAKALLHQLGGGTLARHLRALLRLPEDAAGVEEEEADLAEVYLLFCSNVLTLFEEVVKKLERDATTSADLYAIMDSFLKRLIKRRDDKLYGYLTRRKLQLLSPHDTNRVRQEFTAFLDTAIGYVRKWFNFSDDNWHFHVKPLCLTSGKISYDDMEKMIEKLHLVDRLNLSMDELYDECVTANGVLGHLKGRQDWPSKGTAEKWVEVLRGRAADLPNILAVVSFVLSIPSSTGIGQPTKSANPSHPSTNSTRSAVRHPPEGPTGPMPGGTTTSTTNLKRLEVEQ
ncbi:unnamed protein product [Boreogadus saida]